MKTLSALLAALVIVAAVERPAQAAATVSVEFFYDALAPYGDWVEVEGYGYCFRPTISVSDPGWRPYTEGSWVYTDAGWTWESDEDFGWACFHYGRWFLAGGTWFWMPAETWGPAWVSWRTGTDFIGWAPLPPEAIWEPATGFNGYVEADFNIGPACYNFVPVRHFGELRLRRWIEPWQRNDDCMRITENFTRITHRSTNNPITAVFNAGPDLDRVARQAERGIRRLKLSAHEGLDISDPGTRLRNWTENDNLRVIAPRVQRRGEQSAPKVVRQRLDRSQVNHGWEGFRPDEVEDLRNKQDKLAKRDRSKDDRAAKALPATEAESRRAAEDTPPATAKKTDEPGDTPGVSKKKSQPTTAAQDTPPTSPRETEGTKRVGPTAEETRKALPGRDSQAKGKDRTLPEGELRRPQPPTPGDDSERQRLRPGDAEELRKAIPEIPGRDLRPTPPERLRTDPQDAPPRSTPSGQRPGIIRPDDTPPGPPRNIIPGESTGTTQRPLPKMRPDIDKKSDRPQQRVIPQPPPRPTPEQSQRIAPPIPPQQPSRAEPQRPMPTPTPQALDSPTQGPRPSGGPPPSSGGKGKGKSDDDKDKDKKPR